MNTEAFRTTLSEIENEVGKVSPHLDHSSRKFTDSLFKKIGGVFELLYNICCVMNNLY